MKKCSFVYAWWPNNYLVGSHPGEQSVFPKQPSIMEGAQTETYMLLNNSESVENGSANDKSSHQPPKKRNAEAALICYESTSTPATKKRYGGRTHDDDGSSDEDASSDDDGSSTDDGSSDDDGSENQPQKRNIDTIPPEIARMIIDQLSDEKELSIKPCLSRPPILPCKGKWRPRTWALLALSMVNKAASSRFRPILYETVSVHELWSFLSLAEALLDPNLACFVKHATLVPSVFKGVCSHHGPTEKLLEGIKKADIWSQSWEDSIVTFDPHALCGFILTLVPNLITLDIATTQMLHAWFKCLGKYQGVKDKRQKAQNFAEHYIERTNFLVSPTDLFGHIAESDPERTPKLAHLKRLTTRGLVPLFFFNLASLDTISIDIGNPLHLVDGECEREFPTAHYPIKTNIADVIITLGLLSYKYQDPNGCRYFGDFWEG